SALAHRAVGGGTPGDDGAPEHGAACEARQPAASVHAQLLLVVALGIPEVAVVVDRRAAVADGDPQHLDDGGVEPRALRAGQPRAAAGGTHPGAVADLVDVDVPQPGD